MGAIASAALEGSAGLGAETIDSVGDGPGQVVGGADGCGASASASRTIRSDGRAELMDGIDPVRARREPSPPRLAGAAAMLSVGLPGGGLDLASCLARTLETSLS